MDRLDYAKTPTGRKFGAAGSLVGQPSLLERRQAVTDMAALSNRESSLARRLFRQYSRASRKGDTRAGEMALDLMDRSQEQGIELGGIQSYDQRMNAADADLTQRLQTNQELTDMEAGNPPSDQRPMTLTAQGWTPNETLATDPVQAQEGIVGGPSGIDATPIRSGPSPAEGGIMAARNRSVSPISSTRDVYSTSPLPSSPLDDPTQFGLSGVSPVKPLSPEDQQWADESIWRHNYPALSAFMQRAGEVDYQNPVGDYMGDDYLATEQEVANYRWDEQMPEDIAQRRMSKRARERAGLPPNAPPPASSPVPPAAAPTPNPSPTPSQQRNVIDMSPRIPVPRVMSNLSQVMGLGPDTLDVTLGRASRAIDAVAGSPRTVFSSGFDLAKKAHERVASAAYDTGILARRKAALMRKGASNIKKAIRSDFSR